MSTNRTQKLEHKPVLLLLDNHHSHVNVKFVTKAKNNHIILLSFPPHCFHNLQPLNVDVYGPFKNYISRQQINWMINHPGKTMTIYDLLGIVKEAFPLVFTQNNITNSFKKAGICQCNKDVFQDCDFAPSFITDRLDPNSALMEKLSQSKPVTNIGKYLKTTLLNQCDKRRKHTCAINRYST